MANLSDLEFRIREGVKKGIGDIRAEDMRRAREREFADSINPFKHPLQYLLTMGIAGAFIAALFIICGVAAVFMAIIYGWQFTFTQLSALYAVSGISFALVIGIVGLVLIIGFWAFCIWRDIKTNRKSSLLFAILCIVCYAITNIWALRNIADCLLAGVFVTLLPTFVLIDIEYFLSKGYGLFRKMAYKLCKGKGLRRTIFAILGALTFIISLAVLIQIKSIGVAETVMFGCSLLPTGILFIYLSVFGKTAPIEKILKNEEENSITDNTDEKEWFSLTAEYNGKTYQCSFDEDGQYQDVSSNEQFYYHGGVEPALGDKSGFYFLVFVTYDNYLATVIPFNGITPQNYDEKFNEMIKKFESSKEFKELSDYHMERCARLLMEEEGYEE
ncbi:MAG: hypothetical protein J1F24_05425 [Oscillospiraceae bacterium]|nr:hypothetical protein [Oscillospiraceae bacterium]